MKDAAWTAFFARFMSPQTARFVLALLALLGSAGGTFYLMAYGLDKDAEQAVIFAIGQLFGLSLLAFGYYFGSTARGDDRAQEVEVVNDNTSPIPVAETDGPV